MLIGIFVLLLGCSQKKDDNSSNQSVDVRLMYSCSDASDCVAVGCGCRCSGCGGFSFDEIINKDYTDHWHELKGCEQADPDEPVICPMVCCTPGEIVCVDGTCGFEATGGLSDHGLES